MVYQLSRLNNQMAEEEGFEPSLGFPKPVFKTGAINHSTTPPFITAGPKT